MASTVLISTPPRFAEAKRHQESWLAPLEKKVLLWLAARMPGWVTPDHLTLLGLASMALAGAALVTGRIVPAAALSVPFLLALNWFGDSLDGTLARFRNKQRPRYGFYVDHIVDAFSTIFLLGGLALSGWMTPVIALSMLVVYFLLSIDSYLATHTIGKFEISYFKFSPTELRILLAIGVIYAYFRPVVNFAGDRWLFFDAGAVVAIPIMLVVVLVSIIRHTITLYRMERV
jgi:archaetidylinositol phosphate synthase